MNDPGLDATVSDNAPYVDKARRYDDEDEEEAEADYMTPRSVTCLPAGVGGDVPLLHGFMLTIDTVDGGSSRRASRCWRAPLGPSEAPAACALWSRAGGSRSLPAGLRPRGSLSPILHGDCFLADGKAPDGR